MKKVSTALQYAEENSSLRWWTGWIGRIGPKWRLIERTETYTAHYSASCDVWYLFYASSLPFSQAESNIFADRKATKVYIDLYKQQSWLEINSKSDFKSYLYSLIWDQRTE